MNQKYLSIEGLRGVLAVMVCFGHYGVGQLFARVGLQFNLHFAVDIFFVISGFVLAYSNYFSEKYISSFEFALKRFARLYPLHLLTLLVMCGLYYLQQTDIFFAQFIQHVLLIQNLGFSPVDNAFNFPSWSISDEFWGSILFFILISLIKRRSIVISLCVVMLFGICIFYPNVLMGGDYEGTCGILNAGLLRALCGIGLGIVLYLTYQARILQPLFNSVWSGRVCLLGLIAFFLFEIHSSNAIVFYLLTYGLLGHMALHSSFLNMLSTRMFVGLGAISYAIYLLHIPLYKIFQLIGGDGAVKGWGGKVILIPTLFLLAYLSYRYFERPLQRIILSFRRWMPLPVKT